jgi:hypothetical protein
MARLRVFKLNMVLVLLARPAFAQHIEIRRHYEVTEQLVPRNVRYVVTEIVTSAGEAETRSVYLVEESNGDRFVLMDRIDFLTQESVKEITDLATKEYARATAYMPYKASTRTETIAEMKRLKGASADADWSTVLDVNGVTAEGVDGGCASPAWRDQRSALRRAATPQFLERLERMRPLLSRAATLTMFCYGLLRFVLYEEACDSRVRTAELQPDCTYDASFGFPCTEKQKQKIAQAAAQNKVLTRY